MKNILKSRKNFVSSHLHKRGAMYMPTAFRNYRPTIVLLMKAGQKEPIGFKITLVKDPHYTAPGYFYFGIKIARPLFEYTAKTSLPIELNKVYAGKYECTILYNEKERM